jgi:hypothetical protein
MYMITWLRLFLLVSLVSVMFRRKQDDDLVF